MGPIPCGDAVERDETRPNRVTVHFIGADPGTADLLTLRGTLETIADQVEAAGIRQAALIFVGNALDLVSSAESHLYSERDRDRPTP